MARHENGINGMNGDVVDQKMLPFEIDVDEDEEHQSLLRENLEEVQNGSNKKDLFMGRNAHGMRRRTVDDANRNGSKRSGGMDSGNGLIQGFLRTDLMSHAVYHLRNFLVLGVLAFFVLLVLEWEGGILRSEVMEEKEPSSPHMFSFGGKNNWGHNFSPFKARVPLTSEEEADLEDEILGEGVESLSTWDLSLENRLNEQAHYLHDSEQSPFASNLYLAQDEELDDRQRRFTERMAKIVEEFGVWNNPSFEVANAPSDDFFEGYSYRDVPPKDFPEWAWQIDEVYIRKLLDEAEALVEATKEGIMQEYHHPNPTDEEKDYFGVIIGDHHEFLNGQVHHNETKMRIPGVAYLPENAWKGLIRKLLHAMVTSDHFYVVVAGGGESYKANNFAKSQVMQFNYIMEPIFHKLGMTLISRNMGMSASTAVSSLGGASVYGETDILWHVERIEAEEKPGEFDLLQKQAIMSGERVPIVLSPQWDELMEASKGKAWVGNIQPGVDFCKPTTMDVLPDAPACHNVYCDTKAWESRKCYVYDSVCWELRDDWNPETQADEVGDQDKDYPGYRRHQLEGRKMTLLLLHALNAAIELWRDNLDGDRAALPLSTDLWHVGDAYINIREAVMSLERVPGEVAQLPACEGLLKEVDARICHVPMHAFTEWTPRVVPDSSGLTAIINNLILGDDDEADLYDGPDILPLAWQLPDDEVDVHMIAIAANVTSGYDDDLFGGQYLEDDWYMGDDWWSDGNESTRRLRRPHTTEKEQQRELKDPEPKKVKTKTDQGNDQAKAELPPNHIFNGERLEIAEGSGWRLADAPIGFCDGSAQSRCNRRANNQCLLANHNHYKGNIVGGPKNNWLTMRVPTVRHGIVLARLEFEGYEGSPIPSDLLFDYAVNGLVKTVQGSELQSFSKEIVTDLRVYPLLNARDSVVDGDDLGLNFDIAVRVRSNVDPNCAVHLSHIYYA